MNYTGSIDLLKIEGAVRKNGWVCIPEKNLNPYGESVYLILNYWETKNDKYGKTHIAKHTIDKERFASLTPDQKKALPIIGHLKEAKFGHEKPVQTATPTTTWGTPAQASQDEPPF